MTQFGLRVFRVSMIFHTRKPKPANQKVSSEVITFWFAGLEDHGDPQDPQTKDANWPPEGALLETTNLIEKGLLINRK